MSENDVLIKICILFHPSGPFSKFISKLIENFEGETLPTGFSFLGVKISAFKLSIGRQPIKFLLFHTINQDLFKKLFPYYSGSSGALILFSRDVPDSYEAAKCFFLYFRTLTVNPHIPVTFIDVLPQSADIFIEDRE